MLSRITGAARASYLALGRVPAVLLCVAALAIAGMYCSNTTDDQPGVARGDGVYRPILARGDGHMHFLLTRSLVFDHDLDADNDLASFGDPWRQPVTVTGRKNVMQQIGPSLIWAPVLAAAHGLALVANVFGAHIPNHGYTAFHQRILFTSSVVFAWLAIALGVLVAFRLLGGRWAASLAGVAILLGTSLTYYATYMPSYAHAMDAAACAGFVALWALTIGDWRWRRIVWLGVLLGIATEVRIQDVAFGIVLAAELVLAAVREPRTAGKLAVRGAVTLAIALALFAPQLYEWKQMYGAWLTTPQGPGQMRYAHPMVSELLFSPRNGWLSNTPIAYLATIGLVVGAIAGPRLGRHARLVCIACLLAIAAQVYINAVTYEWWSGASFGQRRMCSVSLPLVIGLAALARAIHLRVGARLPARAQIAIAVAILGYLVAWNLDWVGRLRHGRPAGRDNVPTCCRDADAPLSWIARPVYAVLGNPFELPASAVFSIEYGVGLARFDQVLDAYPLVPGVLGYLDGSYRHATGVWDIAGDGGAPWLLDGFGPPQRDAGHHWRWTTAEHADLLVPLLMPEPHRITIPIAANTASTLDVTVRCNGTEVAHAQVGPTWTTLVFDTDGALGENRVEIEAAVAPYALARTGAAPAPPPTPEPVGVAIGPLLVALPQ